MAKPSDMLSPAETTRWTRIGMLAAFAMALGYLETFLPVPIPGVKLGLANIAILIALAEHDIPGAFSIAAIKVLAAGLLFGNPMTMAFSAAGTAFAFCVMALASQLKTMHLVMVSVVGALAHESGQLAVAMLLLGTPVVWYSAPILLIAGCITGFLCGTLALQTLQLLQREEPSEESREPILRTTAPESGELAALRTGILPPHLAKPALIAFLVYLVAIFHLSSPLALLAGFTVASALLLMARITLREIGWTLKPLAAMLTITAIAQIIFCPSGETLATLGPIAITGTAVRATAIMMLRLLDITAASVGIMGLVGTPALIDGVAWMLLPLTHLGVRTQGFVLALRAAIQAVPSLAQDLSRYTASVPIRSWRKAIPRLIAQAYREA